MAWGESRVEYRVRSSTEATVGHGLGEAEDENKALGRRFLRVGTKV